MNIKDYRKSITNLVIGQIVRQRFNDNDDRPERAGKNGGKAQDKGIISNEVK
jgi:hypothetical protein